MLTNVTHPIPPVFDADSRVLILGSFPSVKSRETGFFYGHPQNRFWKVIAAVFEEDIPKTIEEKKACLLRNHIAVWDVIRSCDIKGSSDASIKNVTANNLDVVLKPYVGRPAICLPSTSPANAAWNMERLIEKWKVVKTPMSDQIIGNDQRRSIIFPESDAPLHNCCVQPFGRGRTTR